VNFLGIGGLEILVIALVAFLVLGPRKMAEAGKTAAKVLSQLRKQRDELTAALLEEPGKEAPGAGSGGTHGRPAPRPDGTDDDFPGYPGGAALREPIKRHSGRDPNGPLDAGRDRDAAGPRPDSDGQSGAPRG